MFQKRILLFIVIAVVCSFSNVQVMQNFYKYWLCNSNVNRVDQLMMSKTTRFKTRRWPMSVLSYELDTARVNARTIALIKNVRKLPILHCI